MEHHHALAPLGERPSDDPFFIIGTDRSGTTLLRLMLNAHGRLHVPRESWFLADLMDILPSDRPLLPDQVRLASELVTRHWRWRDWQIPDDRLRETLAGLHRPDLGGLVDRIFRLVAERSGKRRWGDKTPGYIEEIDRLHRLFPGARFLHIIRDGRDVCLSLRALGWRGRTIVDIARYWSRAVSAARAAGRGLPAGQYCELDYEDLVLGTRETLERACAFLGEAFDEQMLRFHDRAAAEIAPWETAIHGKLVRPPEPSDVGRWRREMSAVQVAVFEAVAGETMSEVGQSRRFRRSASVLQASARTCFALAAGLRTLGLLPDWRTALGRLRPQAPPGGTSFGAPRWTWEAGPLDSEHSGEWDALARRASTSPFATRLWMQCFVGAFLPRGAVAMHWLRRGGALVAVLPLRRRGRLSGSWSVIANAHTQGVPLALDETEPGVFARVLEHLLESAAAVDFGRLPADGVLCRGLVAAARRSGLSPALAGADGDVLIELAGSWQALRGSLSRKLQDNTERRERQLRRLGPIAFVLTDGGPQLDRLLEECFELETRGWKGRWGSPIRSSVATLRFYTELARAAAEHGYLALYTLRLDSRLLAFEYCLRGHGQMAPLKHSFDPEFARYSPGNVLRFQILKRECELGEVTCYSLGREEEWKRQWATRIEPVVRLRVYSGGLRGRVAYAFGPVLRALARRSPALRALVSRARGVREARRRRRRREAELA